MRIAFYILLLVVCGFSCVNDTPFFEENKSIANKTWELTDTVTIDFEITDTTKKYDFFLNLRTTANYEYSNIHVFYRLYFPNNKRLTDKAQFILAQRDGKWLGKTISGSLIENSMLFSEGKRFPLIGKYSFQFIHGMRDEALPEVSDVGLKIVERDGKK